ncbi:nucleoside/nucleotide kinase family protein [Arthrobacter tumbae]|uniref:nucleoside/nucleotide kinase family protein n=1 Tax=Arthrobacter tumbae TaxID=163874 RepID=UPI0027DC949B|nr:nucleoside/nucleotide kinase family protein [Arthrobacter tumbae]MBM7781685.1 pantothenate kinase [Arthrobacter tumbae]
MTLPELVDRIERMSARQSVVVIGIVGAPGVGKTTLAEQLKASLNRDESDPEQQRFAHIPLDGFHLSDQELTRLGLLERKGAPGTFDAYGYAALLKRLREPRDSAVYAPGFERTIEQPMAGVIPVYPSVRTVITEGNYLLLDRPGWREVRAQCTEVWYCEQDEERRLERLTQRHILFGKSHAAAAEWVERVDESNARLIEATKSRADLVVRVE